ncbi:hypothetical protein ACFL2V_19575 [Pseudomonadota bacterium]
MSNEDEIEDPLKSVDQIYEADVRQKNFVGTIEDRHSVLESINLSKSVPVDVIQLFETAKNLSLYSWFVYRFHQVSELIAFSALEMALRNRYLKENPLDPDSKQRAPTLYPLLQYARKEGWITNEGFPSAYEKAMYLAERKKYMVKMETHDFDKDPIMEIEEPNEDEILEALSELDLVEAITSNAHKIRNDLAHGSRTLHPNSLLTLRTTSEIINQLY